MKECTKCLISKELKEFYDRKGGKDSKHAMCKECLRISTKIWTGIIS